MRPAVLGTIMVVVWAAGTSAQPPGALPTEPTHKGRPLSNWIEQLKSRQPGEREPAYAAIVVIGEPAVPHLIGRLGDRDTELVFYSGLACGKLGKPAFQPLLKALDSDDHRVVAAAAAGISRVAAK